MRCIDNMLRRIKADVDHRPSHIEVMVDALPKVTRRIKMQKRVVPCDNAAAAGPARLGP